jgi:hypothetical protein
MIFLHTNSQNCDSHFACQNEGDLNLLFEYLSVSDIDFNFRQQQGISNTERDPDTNYALKANP